MSVGGLSKEKREQTDKGIPKFYECDFCKKTELGNVRCFLVFPDGEVWKWDEETHYDNWMPTEFKCINTCWEKVIFT